MPYSKPAFPKALTNANWQKKKGNIAKIAGSTGIGPALEELELAYKSVDWPVLDINATMPQGKLATSQTAGYVFASAKQEYDGMVDGVLRKKLKAVAGLASKTATDWKKKPLIPKSSVKAVGEVLTAALEFSDVISNNKMLAQITQDYNGLLRAIMAKEDLLADNIKRLRKYCAQIVKEARTVRTAEEFNGKFWSDSIRGVGTTLPPLSAQLGIVAEHKAWRKFAADSYRPRQDEEVIEKLREIVPVLKNIVVALEKNK